VIALMSQLLAAPADRLFALFAHERGPSALVRTIQLAELQEWPDLWKGDSRVPAALGAEVEALVRGAPDRLRFLSATDSEYPKVPLLREPPGAPRAASATADTGIRDKFWQRLVVEGAGFWPQPGFAAVTGNRIEAGHDSWRVRVTALDCRPVRVELLSAVVPGAIVVVEGADVGFAAIGREDGVHLKSRNSHVVSRLDGAAGSVLSTARWARLVDALCAEPFPIEIAKAAFNPTADLGDALLSAPGAYILKPRFGSNGFCVVRVTSAATRLAVESDCPDTAAYLGELPPDSALGGRDLVAAVTTHRSRFIDRAVAGIPERTLDRSILEAEIRQDRADGAFFEPRIVVQRVRAGSGERLAILGALCKRIDTPVGASVARDFREEPLDVSLYHFLRDRVPSGDLTRRVEETRTELLAAGDRLRAVVEPLVEARGARVHQFGIDCRLCWNAGADRVELPFLEFQFGIGRIDPTALGPDLAGYKTRAELVSEFGPEVG
jgi:hypothetical protein